MIHLPTAIMDNGKANSINKNTVLKTGQNKGIMLIFEFNAYINCEYIIFDVIYM